MPESSESKDSTTTPSRFSRRRFLSGAKEVAKGAGAIALVAAVPTTAIGVGAAVETILKKNDKREKLRTVTNTVEADLSGKDQIQQDATQKGIRRMVIEEIFPRLGVGNPPDVPSIALTDKFAGKLSGSEVAARKRMDAVYQTDFRIGDLSVSTSAIHEWGDFYDKITVAYGNRRFRFGGNNEYTKPNDPESKRLRAEMPNILRQSVNQAITNGETIQVHQTYLDNPPAATTNPRV